MLKSFVKPNFRHPHWPRFWTYIGHKLLPRRGNPFAVALSVYLGAVIGVFPTVGVALPLTVLVCSFLRIPWAPGAVSSLIAIPPTLIFFFYPVAYGLGLWILRPPEIAFDFIEKFSSMQFGNISLVMGELWDGARGHLFAFTLGIVVVANLTGVLLGAIVWYLLGRRRQKSKLKVAMLDSVAHEQEHRKTL